MVPYLPPVAVPKKRTFENAPTPDFVRPPTNKIATGISLYSVFSHRLREGRRRAIASLHEVLYSLPCSRRKLGKSPTHADSVSHNNVIVGTADRLLSPPARSSGTTTVSVGTQAGSLLCLRGARRGRGASNRTVQACSRTRYEPPPSRNLRHERVPASAGPKLTVRVRAACRR